MKPIERAAAVLVEMDMDQDHPRSVKLRNLIVAVIKDVICAERAGCATEADYYAKHSTTAKNIAAVIRARTI